MVRFQNQKKSRKNRRVFLSICVFLVILLLFISGIDSFSDSTRRHQKESLTYDEDLFFVDYQTVGANIYPDVTIIEKGAGK